MTMIPKACAIAGLLLVALAPQTASAYYDPGVQRWINRDPIEEDGGVNLYAYVDNVPLAQIDMWGLYKKKGSTIIVEGCEIVIVYGHGSTTDPFKFEFPTGDNSAGAAVTCWNHLTNCKIPIPNRIPGAPDDHDVIIWPAPVKTDQRQLDEDDVDAKAELQEVIKGAKQKAQELIKSGKCKSVTIKFIRAAAPILEPAIPPCPGDIVIQPPTKPSPISPPKAGPGRL